MNESVSPMWDQSIIFQEIRLFGELQQRKECPPCIVVEFFDKDDFVSPYIQSTTSAQM